MREGGGQEGGETFLLAEEVIFRLTGHRLDVGLQLLLPGKDHGEVVFSFAQMSMNTVFEITADRFVSRPRLVISRVSHNSILINGTEWVITLSTGLNEGKGQGEEKKQNTETKEDIPVQEEEEEVIEQEEGKGEKSQNGKEKNLKGIGGIVESEDGEQEELDEATAQLYEELILQSEHRDAVMDSSFVLHLRRTLDPKREEARQKMVKDKMEKYEQKYHDLPSSYFNLLSDADLDLGLEDDLGLD